MSSRHSDFWAVEKFCVPSIDSWRQRSFFICSLSPVPKNDNKASRIVTRRAFNDFCEHLCSCLSCETGQQVPQTQRRDFRSYEIEYLKACLAFCVCFPPTELTFPSWYVLSMRKGSRMLQRFKKKSKVQIWMCVCVVVIQSKLQQICCSSCCEKTGRRRAAVTCPRSLTGYLCQHNDGPQSFLGPRVLYSRPSCLQGH